MMRFFILLAVLLVAVGIGVVLKTDPGYVLIAYQSWTVEMPLWLLLLAILLSYGLMHFIIKLWRGPKAFMRRWQLWREHRAERTATQGFLALSEWRWQKAKRYLTRSAAHVHKPVLNYLGAAEAAVQLHENPEVYFAKALAVQGESAKFAVNLRRALYCKAEGELSAAIILLESLYAEDSRHLGIINLLLKGYEQNGQWQALLDLAATGYVRRHMPVELVQRFTLQAYAGLMVMAQDKQDVARLHQLWHDVPRVLRRSPCLAAVYIKALMLCRDIDLAEKILAKTLDETFDPLLITYYGDLETMHTEKQLTRAEAWLAKHGESAALLLTLAKLAKRERLWGKAMGYAEASLKLAPSAEATLLLGELYVSQGRDPRNCYERNLELLR